LNFLKFCSSNSEIKALPYFNTKEAKEIVLCWFATHREQVAPKLGPKKKAIYRFIEGFVCLFLQYR
jgi:hypothetical protein